MPTKRAITRSQRSFKVLVSQMDARQAKIEATHEEWMVAMKACQEMMEANQGKEILR
jgi:hypothetical protein